MELLHTARVLVVGGGGREHAIVDALSRSLYVSRIYCAPGNAGIASQAECVPIKDGDIDALLKFAKEEHIDLTVVGPEVPLSKGITDRFEADGFRVFGPCAAAARVESSKEFAKRLMASAGIPTASYRSFTDYGEALAYVKEGTFPAVLKYDGLAAGKGVVIAADLEEADAALRDMLLDSRFGQGKVVIEDFLEGPEFSYMCLVSGTDVEPLAVAQDHKRAFDGDQGPNTGGMGAYSPVPFITPEDEAYALEKIMKPMAKALWDAGCPFYGVLYGGLMKTASGIKVIEFNCRFGDPETEVVLPRLESDIYQAFASVAEHKPVPSLKWSEDAVIGFVMASEGYPGSYEKGARIKGVEGLSVAGCDSEDVRVYHMGTAVREDALIASGGRVLMVDGRGATLSEAAASARDALSKIEAPGLFHRTDIGHWVL